MARILILANNDIGLYKFRKELIEYLLLENEVFISLPNGEFVSKLVNLGCKFIDTKIRRRGINPLAEIKLILDYNHIIKNVRPDIVLTFTIKPNIYGGAICKIRGVPYIVNITGLGSAVEGRGLLQSITLLLYKVAIKKASCVFFQNKSNEEFLVNKRIVRGKHSLIPGSGVNLNEYEALDYPDDNIIRFLFISRVMKQKGIDNYLDAAKQIKVKYPNIEFHILGFCEESYEAKLKKMQDQGIIKYHGMQADVKRFYEVSHCIVHPTYYPEGMSNVLLESAACARPIITTERSGCKEIVDNGVNGYFVKQQNSQDLIETIERFLELNNESKKQMGLAGRKKVEREFNREIVIRIYSEEIKKIVR